MNENTESEYSDEEWLFHAVICKLLVICHL